MVLDLAAFALAACGAFALRFDLYFFTTRPEFATYIRVAPLIKMMVFVAVGMYRRFWRYASVNDLLALCVANLFASVATSAFVGIDIYRGSIYEFSRSVLFVDGLLSLALTAAIRLSIRVLGDASRQSTERPQVRRRVLVIGAGDAGVLVAREMQRNTHLGMDVAAFLDDDPVKVGKRIHGIPVNGTTAELPAVIQALGIAEVAIAMPKAPGSVVRRIAESCRQAGVASKTIPGVFELLDGKVSVSRLRQVEITDLLRRAPVDVGPDSAVYVQGRTVLVTGAGGSIGFELSRQVAHARPRRLVLLGHGENSIFDANALLRESCPDLAIEAIIADIRDRARVSRVFEALTPDIVFHAAAHKHVPLMQDNPEEAISNNVMGTQNVLDAAERVGTNRFVLISSDKAVSPVSIMGASKRVAEMLVRDAAGRTGRAFVVVRFGNVLGSRGSVVPWFKRQIEVGGPITITHPEMRRFFMTIPEAVHLVLQAGGMGKGGEVFVLKMGEPLRIVQLAEDLIRLSGLSPEDVPITFTGVRSGEKLEEVLWEPEAMVHDTAHPEVLRVVEGSVPPHDIVARRIEALATAAVSGNRSSIELVLSEMIPSYSAPTTRTASSG